MVAQGNPHSVADDVMTDPVLRRGAPLASPASRAPAAQVRRAPNSAGLYDVLDLILDKGIVVDAFVRVSLVGIEILTVDLRVVIASVDTYLRYAEGAQRLQLYQPRGGEDQLPDMMGMSQGQGGVGGMALKHGANKLKKKVTGGDGEEGVAGKLVDGVRHALTGGVGRVLERVSGQERDDSGDTARSSGGGRNGKHGRERDRMKPKRDRVGARAR